MPSSGLSMSASGGGGGALKQARREERNVWRGWQIARVRG